MDYPTLLTAAAPTPPSMEAGIWDNHVPLHVPEGHTVTDWSRTHYAAPMHVVQGIIAEVQATLPSFENHPRPVNPMDTLRSYYRLVFSARYEGDIGLGYTIGLGLHRLSWACVVTEMPAMLIHDPTQPPTLLMGTMDVVTSYPTRYEHAAL